MIVTEPRSETTRVHPDWYRGSYSSTRWRLEQEVAWVKAQGKAAVLEGYLQALPRRWMGFDGAPLMAAERDRLREAAEGRLRELTGTQP